MGDNFAGILKKPLNAKNPPLVTRFLGNVHGNEQGLNAKNFLYPTRHAQAHQHRTDLSERGNNSRSALLA